TIPKQIPSIPGVDRCFGAFCFTHRAFWNGGIVRPPERKAQTREGANVERFLGSIEESSHPQVKPRKLEAPTQFFWDMAFVSALAVLKPDDLSLAVGPFEDVGFGIFGLFHLDLA